MFELIWFVAGLVLRISVLIVLSTQQLGCVGRRTRVIMWIPQQAHYAMCRHQLIVHSRAAEDMSSMIS
jgi:hypothetical protein